MFSTLVCHPQQAQVGERRGGGEDIPRKDADVFAFSQREERKSRRIEGLECLGPLNFISV